MVTTRPRLILAIETTDANCAAALRDASGERVRTVEEIGRGHAERIVELCAETLQGADAEWCHLTDIAVAVGPGTFAGVRAGVAAARGFALSLGIPAHGVTALEAVAASANGPCIAALPGPRGQIFAQSFGSNAEPLDGAVLAAPEVLAERYANHETILIGPAADTLASLLGASAHVVSRDGPDVGAVARIAMERIGRGDHRPAEPFYLRGADAAPPKPPLARADAPQPMAER